MAEKESSDANYWRNQIKAAEADNRYKRWIQAGQQFMDRYRLESSGLFMQAGIESIKSRMIYNLLWSNVQTLLPMLYSRQPEPYVYRKFHNTDPASRMAATIAERATTNDLDKDDLDDTAESAALDYAIVGRGTIRVVYEHTTENVRIPIRQENREDGAPRYFMDDDTEIPAELVQNDDKGLFVLDPRTTREQAPLAYHNWRDFLTSGGRKWSEVQKHGWIMYRTYMTKAMAAKRFGQKAANQVTYTFSPYDREAIQRYGRDTEQLTQRVEKLAIIEEVWVAQTRQVIWLSPGFPSLLDKQEDFLELEGFFNTPRPLTTTFTNDTLIPVPDYAEYRSQAVEMDQITAKIEQITEDLRAGGVYNGAVATLGNALRNKTGGYHPVDEWASFAGQGGMDGAVQEFQIDKKIAAVAGLYQHRQNVKRDADEISGMIDLFRGQQTQKDETLGQSNLRSAMGGLRINARQRNFQRYLRDCLAMKAEIITSQFDTDRILEMADLPALLNENPFIAQFNAMRDTPQGQQIMANPQAAMQVGAQLQLEQGKQMALIQSALALLKDDRMRTFRLDIETDATVALDENLEKEQAGEFVNVMGTFMERVLSSQAMSSNPEMKALAGEMLMFLIRRYKVGRSLEQKIESVIGNAAHAPPQPPAPDPLMLDVQRQAQDDQMDHQTAQQKNAIAAFKAQTDRMKAQVDAVEAAKEGNRKDLELANEILNQEDRVLGNA